MAISDGGLKVQMLLATKPSPPKNESGFVPALFFRSMHFMQLSSRALVSISPSALSAPRRFFCVPLPRAFSVHVFRFSALRLNPTRPYPVHQSPHPTASVAFECDFVPRVIAARL